MMNEKKKKVPQLRFPGFSGEWEERKLGDMVQIKDSARVPNELWVKSGVRYLRSSDLENSRQDGDLFISNGAYEDYKSKTGAPECGDVLFNSGGNIGLSRLKVDNAPVYVQGGAILYARTSQSKDIDGGYLNIYFRTPRMEKYIDTSSTGGTIKHFTLKPANAAPFIFPTLIEQRKISEFFVNLDNLITLHQRKLTHLQTRKKGLLQKMFPKDGEPFPELRFPGFTDAWKVLKLGDVADIIGGGTPSTSNAKYWDGDIDWYSPVEIGNQIYVYGSQKKITELGLQKSSAKILPVGTVLFTARAGIGNTAILAKEGATNQGFQSIVPHQNELDTYFIYSHTHVLKRYGENKGAGSTFVEVSGKQMEKMSISVPKLDEQQKIGAFFKQLDDSITLHQRKLDHLQNRKKALLQQLFV